MKTYAWPVNRKSQVLMVAIIVLVIVFALGGGLLFYSRSLRDATRLQTDTDQAYSLAKSGMGIAEDYIEDNPINPTLNKTYALGAGNIATVITFDQGSGAGHITSTGRIGRSARVLDKDFNLAQDFTLNPPEPPPLAYHWTLVDDAVYDEDATYVYSNASKDNWDGVFSADAYQLEDPPVGMTGAITSVGTYVRYQGCVRRRARLNGTTGTTFSGGQCLSSGAYGDATDTILHPITPFNPNAWTWANIRDMQIVLELAEFIGTQGRVTQLLVRVYGTGGALLVTLRPNGVGDYTNIEGPPPP